MQAQQLGGLLEIERLHRVRTSPESVCTPLDSNESQA
jgi:hypothetical protein